MNIRLKSQNLKTYNILSMTVVSKTRALSFSGPLKT